MISGFNLSLFQIEGCEKKRLENDSLEPFHRISHWLDIGDHSY